jgi:hypothetical protein
MEVGGNESKVKIGKALLEELLDVGHLIYCEKFEF